MQCKYKYVYQIQLMCIMNYYVVYKVMKILLKYRHQTIERMWLYENEIMLWNKCLWEKSFFLINWFFPTA